MIEHLIDPSKIRILSEFADVLPALTAEEKKNLEENLANGFDPAVGKIVVWYEPGDDTPVIVDGYNRYNICREKGIPLSRNCFAEKTFPDKDSVIRWIILGQLSRRNLTDVQKVEIVNKYKSILRAQGKANMSKGGKGLTISSNVNTRKELAKAAGMSESKYAEATTVLNSDDDETRQRLKNRKISVHKAAQIVKEKKKSREKTPEEIIADIDRETDRLRAQISNIQKKLDALHKKRVAEFSKIDTTLKYKLFKTDLPGIWHAHIYLSHGDYTETLYKGGIVNEDSSPYDMKCPKDKINDFRMIWKEAYIEITRRYEDAYERAKEEDARTERLYKELAGISNLKDIPLNFRKKCGRAIIKEFHDNPKYSTKENQWAVRIMKLLEAD